MPLNTLKRKGHFEGGKNVLEIVQNLPTCKKTLHLYVLFSSIVNEEKCSKRKHLTGYTRRMQVADFSAGLSPPQLMQCQQRV